MIINEDLRIFLFMASLLFIISCQYNKNKEDKEGEMTDLLKYGIPQTIITPSDVVISKIGKGELMDVSIKNDKGYDLQIFMVGAFTSDIKKIKEEKKANATSNPSFSKIVEEYEDGFLYEKVTEEGTRTYDFNIIRIVGANEINFQCGNSKEFTESEVKKMVRSIRN